MQSPQRMLFFILASVGLSLFLSQEAQAVPAFARQTGMNCNSCHIGTDAVPLFTHTGRLFAMRGYTRPYVREKIRNDGLDPENPQYGGEYLSLNWTDFWSARFVSQLVQGGHAANGDRLDTTSRPLARMSMFYSGQVTDWLGLWTEIGYLGNQSLTSVTTGDQGPTGKNFFAYDEYRLVANWDLDPKGIFGANSFWGMSIGNEMPNAGPQTQFPLNQPDLWNNGQGGVGNFKEIMNFSVQTMLRGKWWLQFSGVTGADNNNWSDGWNQYAQVSYNLIGRQRNDVWLVAEYYGGSDFPSIMTPRRHSLLCPGTCPPGVVDTNFAISNVPGQTPQPIAGAPIELVRDFKSYKLKVTQAAADRGPHSWYADFTVHGMKQDFESGAQVENSMYGAVLRYFFQRTYGFEAFYYNNIDYTYTDPAGNEHDARTSSNYGITFLWYPAMNFTTHLQINPRATNIVYRRTAAEGGQLPPEAYREYMDKADSYNLGFEYNF
jgi:hypothetical protein